MPRRVDKCLGDRYNQRLAPFDQLSRPPNYLIEARHARRALASLRGVPEPETEEKSLKKNYGDGAWRRARFDDRKDSFGELQYIYPSTQTATATEASTQRSVS